MAEEEPLPIQLLAVLNVGDQYALARTIGDLARNWLAEHGWADHLSELDFTTYQDHYSLPPRGWPVAAIMHNGNNQLEDMVFVENEGGFWEWLDSLGLHFESDSAGVHELSVPDDMPLSLELHNQLATLQAFEWHAQLEEPDYTTIYRTVFEHFGRHPEHFSDLHWRGFEQLCASVFTAQGYTTELGKGHNDHGVDIRLTAHPVYGQQLTVVQAKRQKKKVELNLVQGILGAARRACRPEHLCHLQRLPSRCREVDPRPSHRHPARTCGPGEACRMVPRAFARGCLAPAAGGIVEPRQLEDRRRVPGGPNDQFGLGSCRRGNPLGCSSDSTRCALRTDAHRPDAGHRDARPCRRGARSRPVVHRPPRRRLVRGR